MSEFEQKYRRIQRLMDQRGLGALLLQRVSSFAWATCGASSYINTASSNGEAMLLITPSSRHLIASNIEAPRLNKEERLTEQGWEFHVTPWHDTQETVYQLIGDKTLGSDGPYPGAVDLSTELSRIRSVLTPEEVERFRSLGRLCAQAMDNAARSVKPGQTEHQIAAKLACEAETRGVQAIVNLIATDERIFDFRHPLPTAKKLNKYAMLVLCGRRWGLVCSLTRFVHFGKISEELKRKSQAVARIDTAFISSTRPGRTLKDVFRIATDTYKEVGFPDEWQFHHQGGPAGYEPREWVVSPGSEDLVQANQVYAWNPSIAGVKSEDTILVNEEKNVILTAIDAWPMLHVEVNGVEYERPAILEIQ